MDIEIEVTNRDNKGRFLSFSKTLVETFSEGGERLESFLLKPGESKRIIIKKGQNLDIRERD